jgi:hypothetical protein
LHIATGDEPMAGNRSKWRNDGQAARLGGLATTMTIHRAGLLALTSITE